MSNVTHYNSGTVILEGNELLSNNSNKQVIPNVAYYSLEVTCRTLHIFFKVYIFFLCSAEEINA